MSRRRSFGSIFRIRPPAGKSDQAASSAERPGWWVRFLHDGREVAEFAGPERRDAEASLERHRLEQQECLAGKPTGALCFEDYARQYLAYSLRDHTPSTHRTRCSLVRGKLVPFFQRRALSEISPLDIEHLLVAHGDSQPATRNRMLSALSAMFQRAMALGYVGSNPILACHRAREHAAPLPLVPLAQQARLIKALPPDKRPLFLTALDTGARLGELLRLSWRDVELESRSLLFRRTKNHRPRIVRLSKRVRDALASARPSRLADGELVFGEARGADQCLRWAWRQAFRRAAAEIGQPHLRVHDLRHLAAINLIRCGVDLPTIQAHLGHKHLISTLRYAAYADETASRRAAEALDRLFGDEGQAQ